MIIGSCTLQLKADWCHSLKEKRMVVNSIIDKSRRKFNVAISEIDDNDLHNSIVLGIVTLSNSTKHVDSALQAVVNFIESNFETEIVSEDREIF